MSSLNISIPEAMREWVNSQVASGQYASASDYLRDLIRHDQRERQALVAALIEGEESGTSPHAIDEVIARARQQFLDE